MKFIDAVKAHVAIFKANLGLGFQVQMSESTLDNLIQEARRKAENTTEVCPFQLLGSEEDGILWIVYEDVYYPFSLLPHQCFVQDVKHPESIKNYRGHPIEHVSSDAVDITERFFRRVMVFIEAESLIEAHVKDTIAKAM